MPLLMRRPRLLVLLLMLKEDCMRWRDLWLGLGWSEGSRGVETVLVLVLPLSEDWLFWYTGVRGRSM